MEAQDTMERLDAAISRMNSTPYPTTTIITSTGDPEVVVLCPLALKEFLVEVQCDRLIDNLSRLEFPVTSADKATEVVDGGEAEEQNIDPALLIAEKSAVVENLEALVEGYLDEVDLVATGTPTLPALDISQDLPPLEDIPMEGFGMSKEDAIDVDKAAAASARKKEVVHVLLQQMIKGEHGRQLLPDAEVLLNEELRVIGIDLTESIMGLGQRARLSTKAMLVARFRVGWQ